VLIGFEPGRDFTVAPWLRERLKRGLEVDEIIVGSSILQEPGGKIQFYGKLFAIAGKLEPTGIGLIDSSVFIPMPGAREMIAGSGKRAEMPLDIRPDEISVVMLRFRDSAPHEETALRLEYMFPGHRVILAADAMRTARRGMLAPLKASLAAGALQWVVSFIMIGVLYGLSIGERRRELGILRAMGAKSRDLIRLLLIETLLLSATGGLLGIACGMLFLVGFQGLLSAFFSLPFKIPSVLELALFACMTMIFSLATGFGATLYPILRESGKSPFEAVSEGG
jgi:putative ABC transport system permease protein